MHRKTIEWMLGAYKHIEQGGGVGAGRMELRIDDKSKMRARISHRFSSDSPFTVTFDIVDFSVSLPTISAVWEINEKENFAKRAIDELNKWSGTTTVEEKLCS